MFERYNGLINLNEYFKKEYGKSVDSSSVINLNFCSYETNGVSARFWINDKDECKYLFKQDLNYSDGVIYAELLSSKIAEILGLPSPKVRACTFDGKLGILSKNFLKPGEVMISGSQIIQEFLDNYSLAKEPISFFEDKDVMTLYGIPEYVQNLKKKEEKTKQIHNTLNNLEELWIIIERYLMIKNKFNNKKTQNEKIGIMDNLVKMFLFDILTMQGDRHVDNWGIIRTDDSNYLPSYIYDNAGAYALDFKDINKRMKEYKNQYNIYYTEKYSINNINDKKIKKMRMNFINYLYKNKLLLTLSEDDIINARARKRRINLDILDNFLRISDDIYVNYFIDMISKIHDIGIRNIIEMVEKENGLIFPLDEKDYITSVYEENYKFIIETLMKNGLEVPANVK